MIKTDVDNKIIETTTEEVKTEAVFKYGIAPILIINMVKENRLYRFEMPIGAKLDECEVACNECLNVVKAMLKEAEAKMAEEAKKKEEEAKKEEVKSESVDEDFGKEDK